MRFLKLGKPEILSELKRLVGCRAAAFRVSSQKSLLKIILSGKKGQAVKVLWAACDFRNSSVDLYNRLLLDLFLMEQPLFRHSVYSRHLWSSHPPKYASGEWKEAGLVC